MRLEPHPSCAPTSSYPGVRTCSSSSTDRTRHRSSYAPDTDAPPRTHIDTLAGSIRTHVLRSTADCGNSIASRYLRRPSRACHFGQPFDTSYAFFQCKVQARGQGRAQRIVLIAAGAEMVPTRWPVSALWPLGPPALGLR